MDVMRLHDIKLKSTYLRTETDVDKLKASIKAVGLIHPLVINAKNELIAGGRRYKALSELGWESVPVMKVERDELEQELISIDENLVRKPLSKYEMEKCLRRGMVLYEKVKPDVTKVDLNSRPRKEEKEADEQDHDSFVAVTSEKTGLSRGVIRKAIQRDALSSEKVKKARSEGNINASQANELIRLKGSEQDALLPIIGKKTVKDLRKLVDQSRVDGVQYAVESAKRETPAPKEFTQLKTFSKRLNQIVTRILLEEVDYQGLDRQMIETEVELLSDNLQKFLKWTKGDDLSDKDQMAIMANVGKAKDIAVEESQIQ